MKHLTAPRALCWLVLLVLAWGVLSFGAVYPWAYWPLLTGCFAAGALGLVIGSRPVNRLVAFGLIAIFAAVLLQLIPVPRPVLARVSPATDTFLRRHDIVEIAVAHPPIASALSIDARNTPTERRAHPLSIDPAGTRRGLLFVAGLGVFILGLARALDRRDIRFLMVGLTTLGVIVSLVAVVQKFLQPLQGSKIYGFWQPSDGGSPFGPFVNPNHFAGWIVMIVPLAAGYLLARLHRRRSEAPATMRQRVLWLSSAEASQILLLALSIGVMALALILTLSRSGIGCFAVVLVLLSWVIVRRDHVKSRRNATLACLALVAFISLGWVGVDRVVAEYVGGDGKGFGLEGRKDIWRDTTEIIRDFPMVGSGLNTYKTAMRLYEEAALYAAVEAHSDYLQLAAEGGLLVGLPATLCIGLFITGVRRRFRKERGDPVAYWIRIGAVAGLVGIALQETVEFSLQAPGNAAVFCFLCAVALSDLGRDSITPARSPLMTNSIMMNSRRVVAGLAATLVVAISSGIIAYRLSGPYGDLLGDRHIHRIYNVPEKRLVSLLYDVNGNGHFDVSIDLENPSAIIIARDPNEDGMPERWEHYGPDYRLEKIGASTRGDGQEDVVRIVETRIVETLIRVKDTAEHKPAEHEKE